MKDVRAVIAANAGGINSLEVVVNCRALNRGGNGIVIQNESSRRHMWCDKNERKVRDKWETGKQAGREELWDGKKHKVSRKRAGAAVVEEDYPPTVAVIADVWPSPSYMYYPSLLFEGREWRLTSEENGIARVVGVDKDSKSGKVGKQRIECDVDVSRGVFLEIREYVRDGRLLGRTRFKSYRQYGGIWLPDMVRQRVNGRTNVVDFEYSVDRMTVNQVNASDLRLQ